MLLSTKSSDTCYDEVDLGNNTLSESHVWHESIYVKCLEKTNPQNRKQISGYQGLGAGGDAE